MKKTPRPPKRSVRIPSGRRISDPVRIGVATSKPNSVSLRFSSLLIRMPMTENIVQIAKLTVKANVFMARTEYCLRVWKTCGPSHGRRARLTRDAGDCFRLHDGAPLLSMLETVSGDISSDCQRML